MNSADGIDLINLADSLERALLRLEAAVTLSHPPVWIPLSWRVEGLDAIEQVSKHLSRVAYLPEQDSRETITLPAVVLANESLALAVNEVNDLKQALESKMASFKKINTVRDYERYKLTFHKRLWSLKQAYRKLLIYNEPVSVLQINWSTKEVATNKLTAKTLEKFIQDNFEFELDRQAAILRVADLDISRLVVSRTLSPHLKGTVHFKDKVKPSTPKIHSPVFLTANSTFPSLSQELNATPLQKDRATRSDKKPFEIVFEGLPLLYRLPINEKGDS